MVTSKCFFLVLFFSVALSFGLLCSASDHPRRSEDPRRRYHECQRRCQWETRGEREQHLCEERCERQFRQEQRERQEEEVHRYRHDSNPEDPQRRFEECQEWCQQQGQRQQPQCQQHCRREFEEQREQQEERSHRRHDSNPEDPQRRYEECQQWCEQQGQRQQPQCQQQCRREFEEQREQQEERSHRRHDSNPEDPQRRFEECQQWCEQQGQRQQPQCQQQCRREFEEQREQQEERSHRRHDSNPEDPQRRFEECQQRCEQQGQRQQPQCQQQCQREFQQEREQTQRQLQECQQQCQQEEQRPERKQQCVRQCREKFEQQPNRRDWEEEEEEDEREEGRQSPNPYYFPRRKFAQARFQEDNGNFWVLQKFSQKHHLLKGINEYRVALIEAHPNTFVLPHHCDAEKIYIVTNGKGTITFVTHKNKESFNVVPGVVVRVPAGSTVYLVNQDNKEKLTIAVLHRPVNNPGQFEEFFPAGQEQPQSYYRSFSREILEAVFNTPSEQLEKLFHGRQSQKGMFRRASQEQIKSLSQGATTPKEKEERFAFNLLAQKPKYSNQNGKFFEACPREFELLRNADAAVVGFEINQGSIFVPHYNSKSTFVVVITEGKGHVEMVCPHLSSQKDERRSGEYMKVGAEVSDGDVFVVPAGHPVTYVASQNHNLRALAFGLYHQNSTRIFIAGKNNMVRQMDSAAKEISFGVPSKLIDEVFNNNPQESYFVSREGQKQRGSEESRDNPISSILDFARLF